MLSRTRILPVAVALAAGAALSLPADAAPTPGASDTYVVTVAPGLVPSAVAALTKPLGGKVGFVYTAALQGFSVTLPNAAAPALQLLPGVASVQVSKKVHVTATKRRAASTQASPPSYGLDRIDQRALPLSGSFTTTAQGAGVTAFVIDSGINYTHTDFGGRASKGFDAVTSGGDARDCNGHGTHVAGTIGGAEYGVAKAVKLVAVRVLDCGGSGTTAGVVAGIDWVVAHKAPLSVANMSLGGGTDAALDAAVSKAISAGITFGVAAGNDNGGLIDLFDVKNACNHSPSRVPAAITVAATDATDTRASYSNVGTCVDLFAPGSSIKSDWYDSPTATNTISGTSMAAPHVVGVAALYLSKVGAQSPAQVAAAITGAATTGVVKNPGNGSPNRLLFTNY